MWLLSSWHRTDCGGRRLCDGTYKGKGPDDRAAPPGPHPFLPLLQLHPIEQHQRLVRLRNARAHAPEALLARLEVRAEELLAPDQEALPYVERRVLQKHRLAPPILREHGWLARAPLVRS